MVEKRLKQSETTETRIHYEYWHNYGCSYSAKLVDLVLFKGEHGMPPSGSIMFPERCLDCPEEVISFVHALMWATNDLNGWTS